MSESGVALVSMSIVTSLLVIAGGILPPLAMRSADRHLPDSAARLAHIEPALPEPLPCEGCWVPEIGAAWQWQLSGEIDLSLDVSMYDIDGFETSSDQVVELHERGLGAVCYLSAGSFEKWRPDAGSFPEGVIGKKLDGWPGERWLDVRALDSLAPIMSARLDLCMEKGFDAVEFDNVDGYTNDSGFPLTYDDQLAYNAWLANAAHERGLSAALKNDAEQAEDLLPYFDWALVEQCFQYRECGSYAPFIEAGKAVMEVEYKLKRRHFCDKAITRSFAAMRKRGSLDEWRRPCK